jgi:hypothetical protein
MRWAILACAAIACAPGSSPTPQAGRRLGSTIYVPPPPGPMIGPASWATPNWYLDPANSTGCANDGNSGTAATCGGAGSGPLLTYAQIANLWGTTSPLLNQPTTITLMSSQGAPWNDPIILDPSGTADASSPNLTLQGSLIQQATGITVGTFVQRNRSTGTKNTITAAGQSGAYWTPYVDMFVHDTTVNAYFWIDADLGSATASISEPVQAVTAVTATPYVTISNGDSLTVFTQTKAQVLYVGQHSAGGFGGPSLSRVWLTGAAPSAVITIVGALHNISESRVDSDIVQFGDQSGIAFAKNCDFTSSVFTMNGTFLNGIIHTDFATIGPYPTNQNALDGDVLIDGPTLVHLGPYTILGKAYFAGTIWAFQPGESLFLGTQDEPGPYYGIASLWGPGNLTLRQGARLMLFNGGTQATTGMLLTGGFTIDSSATAFPWSSSTHSFGAAVSINGENVDANGGLSNPQTGTRIAKMP